MFHSKERFAAVVIRWKLKENASRDIEKWFPPAGVDEIYKNLSLVDGELFSAR